MASIIERVHAREVFDSRGRPTVEVEVTCQGAAAGRAIVPSGASTGRFEACELRDGDKTRLNGLGVRQAVQHVVTEIASAIIGADATNQVAIDRKMIELDGTDNKSRLGANAILGTSLAVAYASANALKIEPAERFRQIWQDEIGGVRPNGQVRTSHLGQEPTLPLPMVNMISGGMHAGGNLDLQDYLILPIGAVNFRTAFDWIVEIYQTLGKNLTAAGHEGILVGDEGGYGPKLASNEQALQFVVQAIEDCGLRPGEDVAIGLDVASTHFFDQQSSTYALAATGNDRLSANDMIEVLADWVDRYPIISIEDGLAEDDWEGWQLLTQRLGDRVQLIGDDLFVTNTARLSKGIELKAGNSVLIKLNQIGSLSETLQAMQLALDADYWPVVSARSGETEDTTIADLVVGTGAGQLKVGSVARSERLAKYNQLLRLAEQPNYQYARGLFASLET
jgi:enolase